MNQDKLSEYAQELYRALKYLLDEIPIIAGDSRHDALAFRIHEADKLIREIEEYKDEEELKPCPFCGGRNIDIRQEYACSGWEAVCEDCGVVFYRNTYKEALQAWNSRA